MKQAWTTTPTTPTALACPERQRLVPPTLAVAVAVAVAVAAAAAAAACPEVLDAAAAGAVAS